MKMFLKSKSFLWISYSLLVVLMVIFQSTPHLFEILSVKPLFLLAITIPIAMEKGEIAGAIIGVAGGLLWDMALPSPFGSYGFLFMVFGVIVGLLSRLLLQRTWFNNLFLVFLSVLIIQLIDFFFNYVIFGYVGISKVFFTQHILCVLYTTLISPVFYFLIKWINKINS